MVGTRFRRWQFGPRPWLGLRACVPPRLGRLRLAGRLSSRQVLSLMRGWSSGNPRGDRPWRCPGPTHSLPSQPSPSRPAVLSPLRGGLAEGVLSFLLPRSVGRVVSGLDRRRVLSSVELLSCPVRGRLVCRPAAVRSVPAPSRGCRRAGPRTAHGGLGEETELCLDLVGVGVA